MGLDDFPGSPTASQRNPKPELKSSPTTLPCETKAKPDASVRTPRQTNTQKELPGRSSSFFIFTTPSDRKRGPVEISKVTTYQEHRDTENEDPPEQSEKNTRFSIHGLLGERATITSPASAALPGAGTSRCTLPGCWSSQGHDFPRLLSG